MPFFLLPDSVNIALRLAGNREAVEELKRVAEINENTSFFSNHLTNASIMTFYLEGHPRVYIPVRSRVSQFNIWDEGVDFSGMSGYYLGGDREEELTEIFGKTELIKRFPTGSPTKPRWFYIYKVGE
jgi:hypothetical protein